MFKKLLPIVASAIFSVSGLHAAVVGVEWGGTNIVTSQQSLNLPAGVDYSTTRVWERTGTTALTPTSNYSATAFYGIIQYSDSGAPANLPTAAILNRTDRNGDRFYLQGHSNSSGAQSLSGLVYVKKQDFLKGLNSTAPLKFDEGSSMSLAVANLAAGAATGNVRVVRMAVLDGEQWYVSESYVSSVSTLNISNLLTQSWAAYPTSSLPLSGGGLFTLDYDTLGSEFSNIQAVGVYFLNSHTGNATARDFAFDKFDVSFAAIPEPSSVALLGVTLVGIGIAIRKNR